MRILSIVHMYFPRVDSIDRAIQKLAEEEVEIRKTQGYNNRSLVVDYFRSIAFWLDIRLLIKSIATAYG